MSIITIPCPEQFEDLNILFLMFRQHGTTEKNSSHPSHPIPLIFSKFKLCFVNVKRCKKPFFLFMSACKKGKYKITYTLRVMPHPSKNTFKVKVSRLEASSQLNSYCHLLVQNQVILIIREVLKFLPFPQLDFAFPPLAYKQPCRECEMFLCFSASF